MSTNRIVISFLAVITVLVLLGYEFEVTQINLGFKLDTSLSMPTFKSMNGSGLYHFISPPYPDTNAKHITVFQNVCLEYNAQTKSSQIVIYNIKDKRFHRARWFKTYGCDTRFTVDWPVTFKESDPPSSNQMMSRPAFFFFQRIGQNLFHFFEDGLRGNFLILKVTF